MDKTLAGLLGAVSVLAVPAHAALASPATIDATMRVSSYADLLKPIPNALALLKASAAAQAQVTGSEPNVEAEGTIQPVRYHHHHHHHRRWHHHHHHHHDY